jgi:iron complex transport system substrate-binding protein
MRAALTALVLALALAACGGGDEPAAQQGADRTVTIEHQFGTTTIEGTPERVAVVGLREQDALLALGIVPVAATRFTTDETAIRDWARDELGDAPEPETLESADGIPVEAVAATRPDLIVGRFSGMTEDEYQQLSRIAPVVAQPKGVPEYGESWQDETLAVGEAVGKAAEAERLVQEGEAKVAEAKAQHPQLRGRTAVVAAPYQGVFVYGPADARQRLLEQLGMRRPDGLAEVVGSTFGGQLSQERLDLIDVDALVWLADAKMRSTIEANPLYTGLDVSERAIFLPPSDPLYNATSAVTVLNLDTILERYLPLLDEAVGQAG